MKQFDTGVNVLDDYINSVLEIRWTDGHALYGYIDALHVIMNGNKFLVLGGIIYEQFCNRMPCVRCYA